jgi:hypothetical protein
MVVILLHTTEAGISNQAQNAMRCTNCLSTAPASFPVLQAGIFYLRSWKLSICECKKCKDSPSTPWAVFRVQGFRNMNVTKAPDPGPTGQLRATHHATPCSRFRSDRSGIRSGSAHGRLGRDLQLLAYTKPVGLQAVCVADGTRRRAEVAGNFEQMIARPHRVNARSVCFPA